MKSMKKLFAVVLAVVMLFGVMSVSTFASTEDPEVTVYFTTNMFTAGGYVDGQGPVVQTYRSNLDPQYHTNTGFDYQGIKVKRSEILANLTTIRSTYAPSGYSSDPNVLDAIVRALQSQLDEENEPIYTIECGWDSYNTPNGGYINSYSPDGEPVYYSTYQVQKTETVGGVPVTTTYNVYSGYGLRYAFGPVGNISEPTYYASYYDIYDGMVIVVDYSYYQFFYPAS